MKKGKLVFAILLVAIVYVAVDFHSFKQARTQWQLNKNGVGILAVSSEIDFKLEYVPEREGQEHFVLSYFNRALKCENFAQSPENSVVTTMKMNSDEEAEAITFCSPIGYQEKAVWMSSATLQALASEPYVVLDGHPVTMTGFSDVALQAKAHSS